MIIALLLLLGGAWALWLERQLLSARLEEADRHVGLTETQINVLLADMGRERIALMNAHQDTARAGEEAASMAAVRAQAEQERASASEQSAVARALANEARDIASAAEQEKQQIREERLTELARLQKAMDKIASTTAANWGMTVDVGPGDKLFRKNSDALSESGRETLSRIAGVFLASHGYRIGLSLVDSGKDRSESALLKQRLIAVTKYLMDAGVPGDILSTNTAARDGKKDAAWLEVQIVDTILPENRRVAESISSNGSPTSAKTSNRGS